MKYTLLIFLSILGHQSFSQSKMLNELVEKGEFHQLKEYCENALKKETSSRKKVALHKYLNSALVNLHQYDDYLKGIKIIRDSDTTNINNKIYFYTEMSNYYRFQKRMDSALFYSNKSMVALKEYSESVNNRLKYRVYTLFADTHRNRGVKNFNHITPLSMSWDERNYILNKYLDTALIYTTKNYERVDIDYKRGLIYLDGVSNNRTDFGLNEVGLRSLKLSNKYFDQVIRFSKNLNQVGRVYSFIGLNYSDLKYFMKADLYYEKSIEKLEENESNMNVMDLISALNWKGTNLYKWYTKSKDITLLDKSIEHYKKNVRFWEQLRVKEQDSLTKIIDGYRVSAMSKLTHNLGEKFLITKDSSLLNESFMYSDQSKYPDFKNLDYSISKVQSKLEEGESFLQYITVTTLLSQEIVFLILKDEVHLIVNDKNVRRVPYYLIDELYQFNDLNKFKRRSFDLYNSKFKQVDSILKLKGINEVIISNSDYNPMLNYDLIIRDTLSNKWEDQPYLFHDYNFSYALCVRSFIESRSTIPSINDNFGLSIGDFERDVDLRFSKKLVNHLKQEYETNTTDIPNNLKNNNIVSIIAHGNTNYDNKSGAIRASYNTTFSVDDLSQMELKNDFVMITACSSNASQTNYSEGSSGNFSKTLRYSGVRSTLTTSWDIDDKSNSFIMTRFFKYLSDGDQKNVALWKSKKDYWNQSVDEEEFKPLYWAPYIITGNTDPVVIKKKSKIEWGWLSFLLTIPIGIFFWKRKMTSN